MAHVMSSLRQKIHPIEKLQELVTKVRSAHARRVAHENSYAALQNITASELREFGLYRSDLPEVARATLDRR